MSEANVVTADQIINFGLSVLFVVLSAGVLRHVPQVRGFAIMFLFIAVVNLIFYSVVVFTPINESDRIFFSVLSGTRTAFTTSALCGVCVMWLKLYAGFGKHE